MAPTEYSEAILRLLLQAYEKAAHSPGLVGSREMLPLSMVCEGRNLTAAAVRMAERLIEISRESVRPRSSRDGRTLLHRLCRSTVALPHSTHTPDIISLILGAHRRAAEVVDQAGMQALHVLAASPQLTSYSLAIAKLLLHAFPGAAGEADKRAQLPLHLLCGAESLSDHSQELCRVLLERFEPAAHACDTDDRLPLHKVCGAPRLSRQSVEVCRQLLLANKQSYAAVDYQGLTPLHILCGAMTLDRRGTEHAAAIVDQLMWTDKAATDAKDHTLRLPLHVLCAAGLCSAPSLIILARLLKESPRAAFAPDASGCLPLHLLCQSHPHTQHTAAGYQMLSKALEEDGRLAAECKADGGQLPLHCLCGAGWHTEHSVAMFEGLLGQSSLRDDSEAEADSWSVDGTGMTPMHWLCAAWGHSAHSEAIFDRLMGILEGSEKTWLGAEVAADDNTLPLHILCGAGEHTMYSEHMYEKLVFGGGRDAEAGLTVRTRQQRGGSGAWRDTLPRQRGLAHLCSIPESPTARQPDSISSSNEPLAEVYLSRHEPGGAPFGRLPLHFLCESRHHTASSLALCQRLLNGNPAAACMAGDDGEEPLHLLCAARSPSKFSVDICRLLLEHSAARMGGNREEAREEAELRALLFVCQSHSASLTPHSVTMTSLLLQALAPANLHSREGWLASRALRGKWWRQLPLQELCRQEHHGPHSAQICQLFLSSSPAWAAAVAPDDGLLPLHALCDCRKQTEWTVEMCSGLLSANWDGVMAPSAREGCLPIHILCRNPSLSPHAVAICRRLLLGSGAVAASIPASNGMRPLHMLCSTPGASESGVSVCGLLLVASAEACAARDSGGDSNEGDLPLHRLCSAEPHNRHSLAIARLLLSEFPRALWERRSPRDLDEDEEGEGLARAGGVGDDPLSALVKGSQLSECSADMASLLVIPDHHNLHAALMTLSHKVYRPRGNEDQQKMALRVMIRLSFVAGDLAVKYIVLDEANSGPNSIKFLRKVVDELGREAENPLHHVLRVARLYRTLADQETSSLLVARLRSISQLHLAWAAEIVERLSGAVAKKAIWSPEKSSEEFMLGDSPIGIALHLGDLKIVSHGVVFDVVKEAWPGKYRYEYNPFTGTIYNNLLLEYRHAADSRLGHSRSFRFTWPHRVLELASPGLLLQSPMMMYFLGIVLQILYLSMFHMVVEGSTRTKSSYLWSLEPPAWYLTLHVAGGILYELGQLLGDGLLRYMADPWNLVDVSMYSLLSVWFFLRVSDAADAGPDFIPNQSQSVDVLGIAAIFIWLRMLNVFGLHQHVGPLVKVIQGMVANVAVFLILLCVFLVGFATALQAIFSRIEVETKPGLGQRAEIDLDVGYLFQDQGHAMLALLDVALGNFDLITLFSASPVAFCLTLTFVACTYIMLLNLLIAMMTDTYAKVRMESEQLWRKDRALLMASYTKTSKMLQHVKFSSMLTALPPPLNLVMVAALVATLPFYIPIRLYGSKKKLGGALTWQQITNQLQQHITHLLLFVFVCLPLSLAFLLLHLPLNWIFVVSPGLLDYAGVKLWGVPVWMYAGISRAAGVIALPLMIAAGVVAVPVAIVRAERQQALHHSLNSVDFSTHHSLPRTSSGPGNVTPTNPPAPNQTPTNIIAFGANFGENSGLGDGGVSDRSLATIGSVGPSPLRNPPSPVPLSSPLVLDAGMGAGSRVTWTPGAHPIPAGQWMLPGRRLLAGRKAAEGQTEEGEEGEEEGEGDSEEEGGQSQGGWQGGARSGSLKAEEVWWGDEEHAIWEGDLDDDDKIALTKVHRETMPRERVEEGGETSAKKEGQAMEELRLELGRKMGGIDAAQRALLQTTRELQEEASTLQTETRLSLSTLQRQVLDSAVERETAVSELTNALKAICAGQQQQLARLDGLASEQRAATAQAEANTEHILRGLYEPPDPSSLSRSLSLLSANGAEDHVSSPSLSRSLSNPIPPSPLSRLASSSSAGEPSSAQAGFLQASGHYPLQRGNTQPELSVVQEGEVRRERAVQSMSVGRMAWGEEEVRKWKQKTEEGERGGEEERAGEMFGRKGREGGREGLREKGREGGKKGGPRLRLFTRKVAIKGVEERLGEQSAANLQHLESLEHSLGHLPATLQAMKEAILRSEVAVANLTQTLQTATPIARSGGSESEGGKGEEGGEERAPGWASSLEGRLAGVEERQEAMREHQTWVRTRLETLLSSSFAGRQRLELSARPSAQRVSTHSLL